MSKPIAYFGYSKNNLTVSFKDLTLENPTSYQWGFGDGNSSTEKNPVHIYTEPGYYKVTLVAVNADGESDPFELNIEVSTPEMIANITLLELINDFMPTALLDACSISKKAALINKWQLYLQPLVYLENPIEGQPPLEVSPEDTHNEFEWPVLFNYLIAQLSAYDIILQGANQFLANMGNAGGNTTTTTTTGAGQIKSIETGPAKTEWYENKTSEEMSTIGEVFSSATRVGGALDKLQQSICQLASRLRIYLPMCGQLSHNTTPAQVTKARGRTPHNANPFGITRRMT